MCTSHKQVSRRVQADSHELSMVTLVFQRFILSRFLHIGNRDRSIVFLAFVFFVACHQKPYERTEKNCACDCIINRQLELKLFAEGVNHTLLHKTAMRMVRRCGSSGHGTVAPLHKREKQSAEKPAKHRAKIGCPYVSASTQ